MNKWIEEGMNKIMKGRWVSFYLELKWWTLFLIFLNFWKEYEEVSEWSLVLSWKYEMKNILIGLIG